VVEADGRVELPVDVDRVEPVVPADPDGRPVAPLDPVVPDGGGVPPGGGLPEGRPVGGVVPDR
jgi:hypothetical protein